MSVEVTKEIQQAIDLGGHAYIGGKWVAVSGDETLPVICPSNGELVTKILAGTSADLIAQLPQQRLPFLRFRHLLRVDRLALLERIHALILERAEPLAQVLDAGNGCGNNPRPRGPCSACGSPCAGCDRRACETTIS